MNRKISLFKICAAVSVVAFFAAGRSDNSSGNCAGSCVDSGDTIEIQIPGDEHTENVKVDSKTDGTEDAGDTKPASSSSAKAPASSAGEAPAASSTAEPASSSETASGDWRDYCLEVVNAKRATEDLPPLARASEEHEKCVVKQAADDMASGKGHANFGDCNEFAQNTGPNVVTSRYNTPEKIVDAYVKMMWDDEKKLVTSGERDPKKDSDYSYIGHYLNMKNTSYKSLACGIAYSEDGSKAWFNMNFY